MFVLLTGGGRGGDLHYIHTCAAIPTLLIICIFSMNLDILVQYQLDKSNFVCFDIRCDLMS